MDMMRDLLELKLERIATSFCILDSPWMMLEYSLRESQSQRSDLIHF